MDFKRAVLGLAFAISTSVNASTVFAPTDGDVNFFNVNLMVGSSLAMFDDNDTAFANPLSIPLPSLVTIAADGFGDFTATNSSTLASLTLTTDPWFILGVNNGGGWVGDTSVSCNSQVNSCTVSFADGIVLSVDTKVVPVPAAVWLFGTGLMGLVGVARRRS